MRLAGRLLIVLSIVFIVSSCLEDPTQNNEEREYKKTIKREFNNSTEEKLIEKAESYYPPRNEIFDNVSNITIDIPDTAYWFYDDIDGIKLPYCLTADAVNFYSGLIDKFNKSQDDNFFITASFEYKAEVAFHKIYYSPAYNSKGETVTPTRFESVYVVKSQMTWKDNCGALCGMYILKERIVIFNEAGEIIKVLLDGAIPTAES